MSGDAGAVGRDGERVGRATLDAFAEAPRYNDALYRLFEPALGRCVLEVGAGIGTFTGRLAARGQVIAADIDDGHLDHLRRRFAGDARVQVRRLDLDDVPVAELALLAIDTVFCSNVLEHVEDDRGALVRLRQVTASGGALLLLVPAHEALYGTLDLHLDHFRRYERAPLRRLLEATGWIVESMRFFNVLGALGWLVNGRVLRKRHVPADQLRAYDRLLAPLLRLETYVRLPFGCSLAVIARRG